MSANTTNVTVTIDGKVYEIVPGVHTVADLRKKAKISAADGLDQDVANVLTTLPQDGSVTIAGGEVFVSFPAEIDIVVNGKSYKAKRGTQPVASIKTIAGVPTGDVLQQDVNGTLTTLADDGTVTINGGEVFMSLPAEVHITVDGKQYKIKRGPELVSTIKKIANVPAAYQLDQDINGVLTPLDQNGSVTINGGEVFVGFPATGSSS
jgi:cell division protein ZapA (FtsZ GTPase activity inhibitor)